MSVVLAQSDCVTAYGWGVDALWTGMQSGKTAIKPTDHFADRKFTSDQLATVPGLSVKQDGTRCMAMLRRTLSPLVGKIDPMTPVILATTVGEIEFVEQAVLNDSTAMALHARPQVLLERVKKLLRLEGDGIVLSSACASSAAALSRAASMIRHDQAKAVLVVSCDAISEFVYSGFSTLMSLCESPARPFDASRSGLSLGEAAAWTLVTRDDHPLATADSPAVLGWGNTADAVHMTAPDRTATGLTRAITKALAMAACSTVDVDLIAAHGTATVYSDAMEMLAFHGVFGSPKPTFSVKGAVGHTLAAAGLVQMLVAIRAMQLGIVPPTVGLTIPDDPAVGWVHGVPVPLDRAAIALSTNSGFGGVNSALLLGRRPR